MLDDEVKDFLRYVIKRDCGYVQHSDARDPERVIARERGCNVLYMGDFAVKAKALLAKLEPRNEMG